jgi:hypothetical protein
VKILLRKNYDIAVFNFSIFAKGGLIRLGVNARPVASTLKQENKELHILKNISIDYQRWDFHLSSV